MTQVFSRKHAELRVHIGDHNVKFHDGVAEVPEEIADRLLAVPGLDLEIETEAPGTPPSAEPASTEPATGPVASDPADDGDPDLDAMDEAELRAFAEEEGIDLGKVQKIDKIRERIAAELD